MFAQAQAKINWTLEVLGTRPDGYHELRSIVLPIALHDDVEVIGDGAGVTVCGCDGVPLERNLVYIAAMKLAAHAGLAKPGAALKVTKRIPAGAGLGGGSADAAATLKLLNGFWKLDLPEAELLDIAAEVGSDVPALLIGEPVMMEGRGERVRRLSAGERQGLPAAEEIEVFTPPIFSSTPAVYREFREEDRGRGRNDLQPAAIRLYPGIAGALAELERRGLAEVAMSGSGSTVYGLRREGATKS